MPSQNSSERRNDDEIGVDERQQILNLRQGINVIKLFFFVTDDEADEARVLAPVKPFQRPYF